MVVTTAATDLTLTVKYTSPDLSTAQTLTVLSTVSEPTGATGFVSDPFMVAGGTTVTITATAGTANQATVSVALRGA